VTTVIGYNNSRPSYCFRIVYDLSPQWTQTKRWLSGRLGMDCPTTQ